MHQIKKIQIQVPLEVNGYTMFQEKCFRQKLFFMRNNFYILTFVQSLTVYPMDSFYLVPFDEPKMHHYKIGQSRSILNLESGKNTTICTDNSQPSNFTFIL